MTEDEMVGWDHLSRCIYTGTIQMYFPRMLDACICICQCNRIPSESQLFMTSERHSTYTDTQVSLSELLHKDNAAHSLENARKKRLISWYFKPNMIRNSYSSPVKQFLLPYSLSCTSLDNCPSQKPNIIQGSILSLNTHCQKTKHINKHVDLGLS